MYIIAALIFWPVWFAFLHYGHGWLGLIAGVAAIGVVWFGMWKRDQWNPME